MRTNLVTALFAESGCDMSVWSDPNKECCQGTLPATRKTTAPIGYKTYLAGLEMDDLTHFDLFKDETGSESVSVERYGKVVRTADND